MRGGQKNKEGYRHDPPDLEAPLLAPAQPHDGPPGRRRRVHHPSEGRHAEGEDREAVQGPHCQQPAAGSGRAPARGQQGGHEAVRLRAAVKGPRVPRGRRSVPHTPLEKGI